MKNDMKNGKTSEIGTVFGQEKLKVTCIERKYKVSDSKIGFIVTAKKELDENTTQELLHEDMELKTFLANYQITDIVPVSVIDEPIAEQKVPTRRSSIASIMTKKGGMSARNDDIIVKNDHARIRSGGSSTKGDDKLIGNHNASQDIKNEAAKRRDLFDSLELKETFVIKDYKEALAKKGVVTTNTAMPYDDLDWLEKQGKVVRMGKDPRGAVAFMIKKKENAMMI